MEIKITKRDVIWNYIAQFFNIGSGLIILPIILRLLSPEEVGMNYLMLAVSSLVALVDFGFSSQFARNITYVFSGAQELRKEGMADIPKGSVNFHLLSIVIETAKHIYRRLSVLVFIIMISFGSLYIYNATGGFTTVENALVIWILFAVSTFFGMYFQYYGALLDGAAKIMESRKAVMLNRISYLIICFSLLFVGLGLLSIVVAGLLSAFVGRWYSYRHFYTKEIREKLKKEKPSENEIKQIFNILWFNARKLGINFIGAYGIQQSGTFVIGLFLPLKEVASYGLMVQLFQTITSFSTGLFTSLLPSFYKYRVENENNKLIKDFSFSVIISFLFFIVPGLVVVMFGDSLLRLIGSSTTLPVIIVMVVYFIHLLLENFHSMCASMIVTANEIPFVKAAIYSGVLIVACNYLTLKYTTLGLFGVVIGQLFVQMLYNHWRWPLWIFRDFKCSFIDILRIGSEELVYRIKTVF